MNYDPKTDEYKDALDMALELEAEKLPTVTFSLVHDIRLQMLSKDRITTKQYNVILNLYNLHVVSHSKYSRSENYNAN